MTVTKPASLTKVLPVVVPTLTTTDGDCLKVRVTSGLRPLHHAIFIGQASSQNEWKGSVQGINKDNWPWNVLEEGQCEPNLGLKYLSTRVHFFFFVIRIKGRSKQKSKLGVLAHCSQVLAFRFGTHCRFNLHCKLQKQTYAQSVCLTRMLM